tara:strand:+ start:3073 stop:3846 length:774 start_codon:yes stop_codon:yes gene_type:complete
MTIPEDRLLAYVDGLLSPEEIADIERRLADDPEASELVDALRRSDLPYREAAETLIAVPDLSHLAETIRDHVPARRPSLLSRYAPVAAAIAVFFAIGLLAGQYVFPPTQPEPTKWTVWLDRIASYQALYSRSTLAMGNPPPARRLRQMERISKAIGTPIVAPDLSSLDADFKYARLYKLDGLALAQIAYLPKTGEPFSLCLMKTDSPDESPRYSTAHGINVVTWRHGGVAYVYVGETPRDVMDRYIAAMRVQSGARS